MSDDLIQDVAVLEGVSSAGVSVAHRGARAVSAPRLESDNGNVPIGALLHFAVEKGMPAAELKELVALHEHMTAREAAREFNRALSEFQAECPYIGKSKTANISTSTGGSYSYTYAPLDETVKIVRPILRKHGLSFTWNSRVDGAMLTCDCTLRHENGHAITSSFTLPTASKSAMSEQQKVGAALTFAQRKSLESALGLSPTDDDTPASEVDPTPITADQAMTIEDLLTESGANSKRFLAYMEVPAIEKIRAADYDKAVTSLREVLKKKQQKEAAKS